MSIIIATKPESALSNGHICKFSYGYNSMYFDIARKDYSISASGSSAGFLQLFINSVVGISNGDRVFVTGYDAGLSKIVEGTYTVWEIGVNYISVLTGATNLITSGFVNLLQSGKREVEVTGSVDYGTTSQAIATRRFSYDATGVARCYVTGIVRDLFAKRYTTYPATANYLLQGAALSVAFDFEDLTSHDTVSESSGEYFAVKSVAQIGANNRMVTYEVYNAGGVNSTAKFLTAFAKPVIWRTLPFSLGFLMGKNDETVYERNSRTSGAYVDRAINPTTMGVHLISVADPPANINEFNIRLVTDATENELYLNIDANDQLLIDGDNFLRIQ